MYRFGLAFFRTLHRQRWWHRWLWCGLCLPSMGHSMINTHDVFSDPAVAELAHAARSGDLAQVQLSLRRGVAVKTVGKAGMTVSQYALQAPQNGPEILGLLLQAGADPVSMLANGNHLPYYVVARDQADPAMLRVLLRHGIHANWFPSSGPYQQTSLLQHAVLGQNLPVMRVLVENGAQLNHVHPRLGSALHLAMSSHNFDLATYLVQAGIDLKLQNQPYNGRPQNALQAFCESQGGQQGAHAPADMLSAWRRLQQALQQRRTSMPCSL